MPRKSFKSRWLALPLALLMALVLSTGFAFAGSLSVDDQANILSSSDRSSLQSDASRIRPNVLIVTTNNYNSSQETAFRSFVRSRLPNANSVVIGLSTAGLTWIEAGTNSGITPSEASSAASAGSSSFKNRDWRGGLSSIINRVGSLSTSGSAPSTGTPAPSSSSGGAPFGICGIIGVIAIIGLVIFFFTRGRRPGVQQPPVGYGPGPNYGPGYGPGPNYGPNYGPGYGPNYGPGYQQGGGSGLGAGLGGAALGGLIGYELGKNQGEHNNPGGGYDAGGGGAVWNNDVGGGGGYDSGGGGANWGGGGGADWGGGGGDNSSGGSFDLGGGGGDSGGGGGGDSW